MCQLVDSFVSRSIESVTESIYYAGVTPVLTPEGEVVLFVNQVTNNNLRSHLIRAELEIRDAEGEVHPRHAHDHAYSLLSWRKHKIILPPVGGLKFETDYSIYALLKLPPVMRTAYKVDKGECPIFYFR